MAKKSKCVTGTNASSIAAGSLKIEISDIGFTGIVPGFLTAFNSTKVPGTFMARLYYDNDNKLFGDGGSNVLLADMGVAATGNFDFKSSDAATLTDPYSLTMVIEITHSAARQETQIDGTMTAVPEPGTVALLGIGLAGLVGVSVRRAKKKAA